MGKIGLLDCTLRDGGNVNNCLFGAENINDIISGLIDTGVNIIEIGFLRDETYNPDRSVYAHREDIESVLQNVRYNNQKVRFAVMIEQQETVEKTFPLKKVAALKDCGIDLIRVTAWERLLEEHLEYCKKVSDMGIKISVQPTNVSDYTDERFIKLLEMVNEIHPYSFYIVDTFGTELPGKVRHLADMADKILLPDIILGYHGHNNKMQSLACLEAILGMNMRRDLLCDASIGGMGKGPGNLQTEVAADVLNVERNGDYNVERLFSIYEKNVARFNEETPWGYSLYYFIGSHNLATQNYASYFKRMGYGEELFSTFVKSLNIREKGYFRKDFTENRLKELGLK